MTRAKNIAIIAFLFLLPLSLGGQIIQIVPEAFTTFINSLPIASILGSTDQFYVRQGGISKQVPFSTIQSAVGGGGGGGGGNVSTNGTITVGDCAQWATGTSIQSTAAPCGTGTVTSVSFTTPAGLVITGSPLTTSGTLALSWSGTIPNSSIPNPGASVLGGVQSGTAPAGQFVNGINNTGQLTFGTPSAGSGNVSTSGTITSGNCAQWNSATTLISTGLPCGSGGGGGGATSFTDYVNIKTYGAIGDGNCHPLSGIYANLAAAQAVYPFVSDLTQCVDWAAIQQAINVSYNTAPAGLFGPGSLPIYCPVGNYELSNPIILDQPNNTAGTSITNPAWGSATTYGNAALVKYNGLPWVSAGSGNVGNPPTAYNLFPAQMAPVSSGGSSDYPTGYPWAAVQISNASPAVITPLLAGGTLQVVANQPLVFFTQHFANPATGSTPALPAGINAQQVYYVVGSSITGSTFQVSATPGGAAVNTSGVGVGNFFISGQVWQFAPDVTGTSFGSKVNFIGAETASGGNTGCLLQTNANWTSPAIVIGPQNGVIVKNVTVYGQVPGGSGGSPGANGYRCTAPSGGGGPVEATGAQVRSIGWALVSNGGGATNTIFENVGAGGFYVNDERSYGPNGEIADHNTWIKTNYSGSCIGLVMAATQAFINTLYDSRIGQTTTGVYANLQEGVKVVGGEYSTFAALRSQFTISGVSTAAGCGTICITATISSPDNNFQLPMCAYDAGQSFNSGAVWLNSWPSAASCGYNTFIIPTTQWGYIGMYIMNYNPFTRQAVFGIPKAYSEIYQNTGFGSGFTSQITAATTMYAIEASMMFFGDNQIDTIHVENDGMPYTLSCFCTTFFGGGRPVELKHVLLNAEASLGSVACCNIPNPNNFTWGFYAQQVIPFINSTSGDTIIDAMSGGGNTNVQGGGFGPDMDRVLLATGVGNYIEARHTMGTSLNNGQSTGSDWNAQGPLFDFFPRTEYAVPLVNPGTLGQLSGGYIAYGGQAYGAGIWDNGSALGPFSEFSLSAAGQPTDMGNMWRTRGWGQAPQWGVRPAPWTNPCILPSQATSLATPPAITFVSTLHDYVQVASGGTGYTVGDTLTLTGGTFTTAAQVQVTAAPAGVITAVKVVTVGAYTVEPAATFGATGGTGTSATFTATGPIWFVNYVIGYPLLWGGHLYHACNFNNADFGSHVTPVGTSANTLAIKSTHQAWSYFQNLTTTNVPHLSWTMDGTSPFIYMNWEALELMFPGLQFTLTGTGGCSGTYTGIVLEVHPTLGYVKTVGASADGSAFVPALAASGTTCTGTTITQAAPALTYPY